MPCSTPYKVWNKAGGRVRGLKELGLEDDTVVMFLSDHGMPFPFAKTNVYHHSSRTPWMVRWPGTVKAGTVDDRHMISAIDFMPTVLDIAGIAQPSGLQGRSFLPLLRGKAQAGRDHVIKEYNENSGGGRHPMRSVDTRRYGYIFNPWSNGTRKFRTATQGTRTYELMVQKAEDNPLIAARLKHFDYRTLEEFYDYEKDPDALHNLIDEPAMRDEIDRLRKLQETWMVETEDPCLVAFRNRDDPDALEKFMRDQQAASDERRKKARARRYRLQRPVYLGRRCMSSQLPREWNRAHRAPYAIIPPRNRRQKQLVVSRRFA